MNEWKASIKVSLPKFKIVLISYYSYLMFYLVLLHIFFVLISYINVLFNLHTLLGRLNFQTKNQIKKKRDKNQYHVN